MKNCRRCGNDKTVDNFHNRKRSSDGLCDWCKSCVKEYGHGWKIRTKLIRKDKFLKKQYGISKEEFDRLLISQNSCCAICFVPGIETYKGLHVDHDHISGRVRGLLCNSCNSGIGRFHDSAENLIRAAEYLSNVGVTTK